VQFLEQYSDILKDTGNVHVTAMNNEGSQDEQEAALFKGHEDRKALISVACRMMTSPSNNQHQRPSSSRQADNVIGLMQPPETRIT
jgi:hypothetical protein